MKAIVEVTICLITVLGSVKSAEGFLVNGIEGENVKIDCTYKPEYLENKKYLCRDSWPSCSDVIRSGEPETLVTEGRVFLYDNRSARVFTVTIKELTQEDAGTYYCGVDIKRIVDEYTEVKVTVNKAPKPTPTTRATRSSTTPSTTTVKGNTNNGQTGDYTPSSTAGLEVIIGGALGAMLFVFLMTIMIYCFTKKKKKNKSVGKSEPICVTPNPVYSEVMNPVHSVTPNSVYSEVMKPVHSVTPNPVYSEVMKPVHSVTPNSVYSEAADVTQANDIVYSEVMKVTPDSDVETVYSNAGFEGKHDAKESVVYSVIGA
ncbi:CMRF35-like molecule 5 isoform X3 [Huso huso]|uniref:CMRF35-like molecule 5 isoform X3 n=1 Tax=Huso huso TaxID=61971 RepID=A0ABR0Y0S0_HUSHU